MHPYSALELYKPQALTQEHDVFTQSECRCKQTLPQPLKNTLI